MQQASYTCLAFCSGLLLVGKADGEVLVLKNGILVAQLDVVPKDGVVFKERDKSIPQELSVADVSAFGSGFVAATAGGNVAVYSSVRIGG